MRLICTAMRSPDALLELSHCDFQQAIENGPAGLRRVRDGRHLRSGQRNRLWASAIRALSAGSPCRNAARIQCWRYRPCRPQTGFIIHSCQAIGRRRATPARRTSAVAHIDDVAIVVPPDILARRSVPLRCRGHVCSRRIPHGSKAFDTILYLIALISQPPCRCAAAMRRRPSNALRADPPRAADYARLARPRIGVN
jgi:hypothetical protein